MKKIKIMRGISGAGKSTLAATFGYKIVSADNYFMVNGEYRFDPSKLAEAHQSCLREFLAAVHNGENIVVDNTNINIEDIAPYVAIGEAYGYDVEILEIDANPNIAANRNVHGVPPNKVDAMWARMARLSLPKRWKVTRIPSVVVAQ